MLKKLSLCALPLILLPAVSLANPLVPVSVEDLVIIDEAPGDLGGDTDNQDEDVRHYGGYRGYYGGHHGGHRGYYGGHRGHYGGHHGGRYGGYYGGHRGGHY